VLCCAVLCCVCVCVCVYCVWHRCESIAEEPSHIHTNTALRTALRVTLACQAKIWRMFAQMLWAVQDCHTKSHGAVLHRDLKPANIFLDRNGNVKIGDFGLARVRCNANHDGEIAAFLTMGSLSLYLCHTLSHTLICAHTYYNLRQLNCHCSLHGLP
jgi:serine/threonine protein kinase